MTRIVVADIGGTHARFALARVTGATAVDLETAVTLKTNDYSSFQDAWRAFAGALGESPPAAAAIAVAGPTSGDVLTLTNNPWTVRPAQIRDELGLKAMTLVNDFGAVGHALGQLGGESFRRLFGPRAGPKPVGTVTILGPGTGLGVAQVVRQVVVETESGHMDFAPLDEVEDEILTFMRRRHGRVSIERIVSGPGLANIYEAIGARRGLEPWPGDDASLWSAALGGGDSRAAAALERLCLAFGSVAGDLALAHGAEAVVLAGALASRLAEHLHRLGFHERVTAKGRFTARMAGLPIMLITHPQPGLLGAAEAFRAEHGGG